MTQRPDWRPLVWVVFGIMALGMFVSVAGGTWWGWTNGGYGMMGGWMWLPLLGLMLIVMAVVMSQGGSHGGHVEDARAVLDRRYAAGELSRDEYQRMRDDLDRRS